MAEPQSFAEKAPEEPLAEAPPPAIPVWLWMVAFAALALAFVSATYIAGMDERLAALEGGLALVLTEMGGAEHGQADAICAIFSGASVPCKIAPLPQSATALCFINGDEHFPYPCSEDGLLVQ